MNLSPSYPLLQRIVDQSTQYSISINSNTKIFSQAMNSSRKSSVIERQEVVTEKVVCYKRKHITIVKSLELFGDNASKILGMKLEHQLSSCQLKQSKLMKEIIYDIVEFITGTWPDKNNNKETDLTRIKDVKGCEENRCRQELITSPLTKNVIFRGRMEKNLLPKVKLIKFIGKSYKKECKMETQTHHRELFKHLDQERHSFKLYSFSNNLHM
ncbi:hypothetical protein YC2023_121648 [Brassica napus]